jgi:tetratricopeptide (TPR) repeat protein
VRVGVQVALVSLRDRNVLQMAYTDANGEFTLRVGACSLCRVEVSLNGTLLGYEDVRLHSGQVVQVAIWASTKPVAVKGEVPGPSISVRELAIPGQARAAFEKGVRALNANHPRESIPLFHQAIELYWDYDEAYVQCGLAYFQLRRLPEAAEVLSRGIEVYAANARARALLGKVFLHQTRPEDAREQLLEAIRLDGNLWTAHIDLGRALLRLGDANAAHLEAHRALELKPEALETHIILNDTLVAQGAYTEALDHIEQMVVLFADQPIAPKLRQLREALAKELAQGAHSSAVAAPQPNQ